LDGRSLNEGEDSIFLFRYLDPISHWVCVYLSAFRSFFQHFCWRSSERLHILCMLFLFFKLLWPYGEKRLHVPSDIGGDVSVLRIPGCALLPLLLDSLRHVNSAGEPSRGP
jgi:hypothetical protein